MTRSGRTDLRLAFEIPPAPFATKKRGKDVDDMGLGFWGLGFRDLGFRGLGFRGLGFRILDHDL